MREGDWSGSRGNRRGAGQGDGERFERVIIDIWTDQAGHCVVKKIVRICDSLESQNCSFVIFNKKAFFNEFKYKYIKYLLWF